MKYTHLLILIILIPFWLSAADPPLALTFHELIDIDVSLPDNKLQSVLNQKIGKFQGQDVRVRGFLYTNDQGDVVLSSVPNLKTCCVGKSKHVTKQIYLSGLPDAKPSSSAVLVQGRFAFYPRKDGHGKIHRLFEIAGGKVIEEESPWLIATVILSAVGFGCALTCLLYKRKKVC